uniref:Uncharacterized protein n=1 Tax=Caenorhabditis japonica TaxID=281687 RepID=A0A8R1EH97_CAEJA
MFEETQTERILYGHTVTWRNEEDDQKKSGVSTSTRHLFSQKRCAEESEPQVVPSKKPSPIPPTSQFEHPKPPQFTQWNVLNVRRTNAISWRIKLPHIRQIPITYSPDGEIRDPRLRNISAISTTLARNLAQSSSSGNLENDDEIELLKTIQYIELSDDEQEEEKPSIIHKEEELEKRPRTLEDDNPGPDETDDDMEDSRSTGEGKEEKEEEEWQKNCKTPDDDDDDYPGSEATQTNSPVSEDDDDMFPASVPPATISMPLLAVSRKNTISEEVQETQDVLDLDFEQILLQLEAEEKLRELAKKKSASFDTDDEDDFFPTTVPTKLPALAAVLVSKEPDEVPSDVHLAAEKEPEDITIDVSPPRFSTSSTCSISPMDENMAPTPTPSPPAQPTLVSFRISNPRIAKMGMWKGAKDDVKAPETEGKTELPEFEYGHRKRWWHMLGEPRQIEEFIFGKLATKFQLRVTHRLRMKMIISMIHQNRNEIITDRTLKCLAAERFHKFKKSRTEVPIEEVAEFVTDMMNDVFLANIDGRDEFLVDSHWKKFDPRILLDPYNPPKTHSRLFWLNIDDINNEDVSRIQWNVQIMCRKLMADLVRTVFVAKHDRRADKFCFFFNGKFDFPEIESMSDDEVWRTIYGVESKSRRKRARIKEEIDNGMNFSNKPGFCVKPPYFVNQIDPTEFEESSYPGATPDERKRLRQQKWQSEHFPYKPPLPRYDLPEFTRLYHIFITYKSRQKEVIDEVHREQQNGEKFDWKDEKLSVIARNFPNHYHLPAAESRFHQAHAFFRKLIEAAVE